MPDDRMPDATPSLVIRPIEPRDDAAHGGDHPHRHARIRRLGCGFAINDPEVDWMSRAYAQPRCAYFVVERDGVVVGGGGVAPLEGGDADTCELRKMYFLPQARGLGAGAAMMQRCLRGGARLRIQAGATWKRSAAWTRR